MKPSANHIDRLARVGLLSSLALVLSYVETMVPLPVALPGVKLGLGNIAVIVALFTMDWKCAAAVAVAKVVASGLLFGSPVMLAYSLGGMALAFAGMLALRAVPGVGVVATSMVSAVMHNAGQLAVAAFMLRTPSVLINIVPLSVAALVTGLLTGMVASQAVASVAGGARTRGEAWVERLLVRSTNPVARSQMPNGSKTAPRPGARQIAYGEKEGRGAFSAPKPKRGDVATKARPSERASHSTVGSFGVYRPGTSFVHKLDPRTKVVFSFLYLIAAFLASGVFGMAAIVAVACAAHVASGFGIREARWALRPFMWLLAFILVFDCLFMNSGEAWWSCGAVCISSGGVAFAAESCVRFACMLVATSTLMATTSPIALADAFAKLLAPLRAVGVKVDDVALVLGLALRFIPVFSEELLRIRTAQISRAADFESGPWHRRVLSLATLATPLVAGALRRSATLASSISSRAYGASNARTCARVYKMRACDWRIVVFSLALPCACAFM